MRFQSDMVTSAGGRERNEDAYGCATAGEAHCWVLADGLGGHGGGEIASRTAVDAILEAFEHDPTLSPDALTAALAAANEAVCLAQEDAPDLRQMRTTVVAFLADDRKALWAHAGDSRLYRFQDGLLAFQTRDHSVPQMLVDTGEIEPEEIRGHEDRARLLRSLGDRNGRAPALHAMAETLTAGDVFLLATDGFWEHVAEPEMEADLARSATPREWLSFMEARLLEAAGPGYDNYSAIAVFVEEGDQR